MPRSLWKLTLVAAIGVLVACGSFVDRRTAQENERFFALPLRQQHDQFGQFPLPRQLEIYLFAVLKRHPPDYSFAYDIASFGGKEVVPFLVDKLRAAKEESVQQSIIYIFEALAREGHELRSDDRVMELVKKKISLMEQPFNRQASERSLQAIIGE